MMNQSKPVKVKPHARHTRKSPVRPYERKAPTPKPKLGPALPKGLGRVQ